MRYVRFGLGILIIILLAGFWYAKPLLEVGTGYAAKMACSCHYLQGRSLDDIHAADLNFSALALMDLALLPEEKGVEASLYGLISQQAQFVEGRGCVLVVDGDQSIPGPLAAPQIQLAAKPLPTYDTLPSGLDMTMLESSYRHLPPVHSPFPQQIEPSD